jgi:hypothetical protein
MDRNAFNIPPPIIPREHGAWAVLFVPMIVMLMHAGSVRYTFFLLALSSLGLFMSYVPAQIVLKHMTGSPQNPEKYRQARIWGTTYATGSILLSIPLLLEGFYLLVPLGVIGILAFIFNFLMTRRYSKTIPGDLLSVFGLSLSGLGAYYVLNGVIDITGILLWIQVFLFFGSSVFYVHMKIQAAQTKAHNLNYKDRFSLGKASLSYHAVVVLLLFIFALKQFIPAINVIAFLPMSVHVIYGTWNLSARVRFKNLGFLLLGQSVLFTVLIGLPTIK